MAPSTAAKLTCEFLGTYLLVFTVGCNVLSANAIWGGVSIACVLMVAIYAMGGISGANFNPAVSFTLALLRMVSGKGGLDLKEMGMYIGCQLAGGICGALSYRGLYGDAFALGPGKGFGWLEAGACEFLYTFMLCFVVLNVAAGNTVKGNDYYGLAIGFVIIAGAYGAGAVSGGCFNPAVATGIAAGNLFDNIGWALAYTIAELAGAAAAAGLFFVVRPSERTPDAVSEQAEASPVPALVSEFVGTYILVLTVGLNVLGRSPAAAFSIAASLMCMIYALGDVSGANFNPAVTIAIALGSPHNMDMKKAGTYIVTQVLGGIAGAFTYKFIHHGDSFSLRPRNGNGQIAAGISEIVFTFLLCYVVLCAAVNAKLKTTQMFGLAIGSCVTVGGFAIGGISGGSLNPAVSWGIVTSHFFAKLGGMNAGLYTLYEIVGAVAAAGLYKFTHPADDVTAEKKEHDV